MNSLGGEPWKLVSLAFLEFFPESKVEENRKEGKDSLTAKLFKIVSILRFITWEIKSFSFGENFRTLDYNAPVISCLKVHSVQEILLWEKNSLKDKWTNSRQFIRRSLS